MHIQVDSIRMIKRQKQKKVDIHKNLTYKQ